jgi:hypothetical protein
MNAEVKKNGAALSASAHPQLASTRGVVEVLRVSDESYVEIYIDGEHCQSVHKNGSASSTLLSRRFAGDFKARTGMDVEEATFVDVQWFDDMENRGVDVDANDFEDYESFVDALSEHGPLSASFVEVMGVGVTASEGKIAWHFP